MTATEEFYMQMSKAIKARDNARTAVERWIVKVLEAEKNIEALIATQHKVEVSDGTD